MRIHNVGIPRNFYQNRLINEFARKKKAKILESRCFLVRFRRTYVLNKQFDSTKFISHFGCTNIIFAEHTREHLHLLNLVLT